MSQSTTEIVIETLTLRIATLESMKDMMEGVYSEKFNNFETLAREYAHVVWRGMEPERTNALIAKVNDLHKAIRVANERVQELEAELQKHYSSSLHAAAESIEADNERIEARAKEMADGVSASIDDCKRIDSLRDALKVVSGIEGGFDHEIISAARIASARAKGENQELHAEAVASALRVDKLRDGLVRTMNCDPNLTDDEVIDRLFQSYDR